MAQIADHNLETGEVVWREDEIVPGIQGIAPDVYTEFNHHFVYRNRRHISPLLLKMQNGGEPFFNELTTALGEQFDLEPETGEITWSSYAQPDREPYLVKDIDRSLVYGRFIFAIDDILDRGETLRRNEDHLIRLGALGVMNIVLVDRIVEGRHVKAPISVFVTDRQAFFIGFGMNHDELQADSYWGELFPDGGRNLRDVRVSPLSPFKY